MKKETKKSKISASDFSWEKEEIVLVDSYKKKREFFGEVFDSKIKKTICQISIDKNIQKL